MFSVKVLFLFFFFFGILEICENIIPIFQLMEKIRVLENFESTHYNSLPGAGNGAVFLYAGDRESLTPSQHLIFNTSLSYSNRCSFHPSFFILIRSHPISAPFPFKVLVVSNNGAKSICFVLFLYYFARIGTHF